MANERHGRGQAEWVGRGDQGCWFARVSVPKEGRRRFKLSTPEGRYLTDKEADRDLARDLAEQVSLAIRHRAYEAEQQRLSARLTVKQFGERWTSGELYR